MPTRDKILSQGTRRPPLAISAAVAVLGVGYADLIRGGITLAPLLLTLGYCVLVPIAIWRSGSQAKRSDVQEQRHELWWGLATALVVLAIYVATLAPTTSTWDTSEYLAAAFTMGLPHPPGNPLFVILGRTFALLPIAPTVAQRINLLAAIASAGAAAIWFLMIRRLIAPFNVNVRWRSVVALAGTLIGACAFTVWHQSTVNEKVYTLALLGIAIISWQTWRWLDEPDGPRSDARLVMIAYLLLLGYANHNAGILPAPAVLLAMFLKRPRRLVNLRLLTKCALVATVGFSPFATQPVRAAHNPPINEGEPTACRAGLRWNCTFSKQSWDAFSYNLQRLQYGKPSLAVRQAPARAQLAMYWLYFKWQWLRDPQAVHQRAQHTFAVAILFLALFGGVTHYRRARATFWYFGSLTALLSVGLVYYLNFKLGASQPPIDGVPSEVRDRDYFYIWSFSSLSVWVTLGLVALGHALIKPFEQFRRVAALQGLVALPTLLVATTVIAGNARWASRRGDTVMQAFAHDLLNSVEPHAILITNGDNDTFSLWYAQQVEGIRRDVTVVIPELLNTDWFPRSLVRRRIEPFDSTRSPRLYSLTTNASPTEPPLRLTLEQADAVPIVQRIDAPMLFSSHGLQAVIRPEDFPTDGRGGGLLYKSDLLVLHMIANSWPERPFYFAQSAAGYPERLGLQQHLVTHGLARKLVAPAAVASKNIQYVTNAGWLDVERSQTLWAAFKGPEAIAQKGFWVDAPSAGILAGYLVSGMPLQVALAQRGDSSAGPMQSALGAIARVLGIPSLP